MSSTAATILLVEDEEDIAFLLRFLLERNGYQVEHAEEGRQALERITHGASSSQVPDLVLLDMMLPYHDGLEILARLRSQPVWEDVPVVMLTAKAREADIVRALELGADDYVTKPFQPDELLARLRRFLRKR
ncbi:response regulator [Halomonas sp. 7T]|uniref:response regulator n=1 Tax=Halomonas sp. 7T TaxID=2893469 RepID=UPI0021D8E66E|nr:response regulator [Halomonas sp. 7T]UXZ54417.1 response regulator [Halomonas sp. 7T]